MWVSPIRGETTCTVALDEGGNLYRKRIALELDGMNTDDAGRIWIAHRGGARVTAAIPAIGAGGRWGRRCHR